MKTTTSTPRYWQGVVALVTEEDRAWHRAQIEKLRAATDRAPLWREVADRIGVRPRVWSR